MFTGGIRCPSPIPCSKPQVLQQPMSHPHGVKRSLDQPSNLDRVSSFMSVGSDPAGNSFTGLTGLGVLDSSGGLLPSSFSWDLGDPVAVTDERPPEQPASLQSVSPEAVRKCLLQVPLLAAPGPMAKKFWECVGQMGDPSVVRRDDVPLVSRSVEELSAAHSFILQGLPPGLVPTFQEGLLGLGPGVPNLADYLILSVHPTPEPLAAMPVYAPTVPGHMSGYSHSPVGMGAGAGSGVGAGSSGAAGTSGSGESKPHGAGVGRAAGAGSGHRHHRSSGSGAGGSIGGIVGGSHASADVSSNMCSPTGGDFDPSVCFLCGNNNTSTSNPIKIGDLSLMRQCWNMEGARAAYIRRYPSFKCKDGAKKHLCRQVLTKIAGNDNLDDMARCYPVDKLDSYLHQDSKLVVNTHKRCRGGLVSLLRFVLALEASASPIKRARVGAPCRLCGQHPSSYPDMQAFVATRNDAVRCLADLQTCLSAARCPPVAALLPTVAEAHGPCRTTFRKAYAMREAELPTSLHCCFRLEDVLGLLGITPEGDLAGEVEMTVCTSCLTSLSHLFQALMSFKRRVEAERAMSSYIKSTVWPGAAAPLQRALRAVLYAAPFRIRTPEDLDKQAYSQAEQLRGCLNLELGKRGEAAVTDPDWIAFMEYAVRKCPPLDTPSAALASVFDFDSMQSALP